MYLLKHEELSDVFFKCVDVTSQTSDHEDGDTGEVTLQEDEAAIDITELFLRYVIRSFLPCDGLLIQEGANELADVWPTIGVGIVLTSTLLKQSSDQLQAEIVRSVAALPGVCRALALAFNIAISFDEAGEKSDMDTLRLYI